MDSGYVSQGHLRFLTATNLRTVTVNWNFNPCAMFHAILKMLKNMEKSSLEIHRCWSEWGEYVYVYRLKTISFRFLCYFLPFRLFYLYGIHFDRSLNRWLRSHICCNSIWLFYCQRRSDIFSVYLCVRARCCLEFYLNFKCSST